MWRASDGVILGAKPLRAVKRGPWAEEALATFNRDKVEGDEWGVICVPYEALASLVRKRRTIQKQQKRIER